MRSLTEKKKGKQDHQSRNHERTRAYASQKKVLRKRIKRKQQETKKGCILPPIKQNLVQNQSKGKCGSRGERTPAYLRDVDGKAQQRFDFPRVRGRVYLRYGTDCVEVALNPSKPEEDIMHSSSTSNARLIRFLDVNYLGPVNERKSAVPVNRESEDSKKPMRTSSTSVSRPATVGTGSM